MTTRNPTLSVTSHLNHPPLGLLAAIVLFAAITPAVLLMAPAIAAQLASQWQLSPTRIGDLFSAELGAMSLATLPAIWWLKHIDWRRAALCSALLFIVANLLSMLAHDYSLLLMARFGSALAGGSLMIICLASAAASPTPSRAYGFWVMGQLVLGAIGLSLLPMLFQRFGLGACYLILALLMTLCLPLVRCFPAGAAGPGADAPPAPAISRLKAGLGILGILTFYISLSGVWTFIGAIGSQSGLSAQTNGDILAIATLMGIVGALCATLFGDRLPRGVLLVLGYGLMAGSVLLLLDQPRLARFALAALVFKFTWTFILPLILARMAEMDRSGRLMNASNLVISAGLAIGPTLAGRLIESSGGFQGLLLGGALLTLASLALVLGCRTPR
ncbi:Predicted arabinose efflux permease, MFS family [Pseudomonas saponiphila]|uniref:Predicted arabinose efflux permease, MFS family n=1 Tax=Pseudomonas saponiphila TaxID=556534 RepID=A0A1H4N7R3_9PSED|nr:MFS transporter [Pseudomonas saponiphila]SEB91366.1 Predicted arabinose efflux permease, MFS family [Pseudomonas saponiphila]